MRELAFGPAPCRARPQQASSQHLLLKPPVCGALSQQQEQTGHHCQSTHVHSGFSAPSVPTCCNLPSPPAHVLVGLSQNCPHLQSAVFKQKRLLQVGLASPSPGPDPGPAASPAWILCVTRPGPLPGPHSGMQPLRSLHQRSVGSLWGPSLLAVSPCESHCPFWSSFSAHCGSNPVPFPSRPPWASPSYLHFLSAWL